MARPSNTAERRTAIARALLKVLAANGYDGASVAHIARVAKIAPGLVHYHFKNKLEILLAAIDELAAAHERRLEQRLNACFGDPARELQAFVEAHLHLGADADPQAVACWITISAEALREPRVKRAFARVIAKLVACLDEIIMRGNHLGVFACREPAGAAGAIMATIHGYFVLAATARDAIPKGSASRATLIMARALVGLEKA